MEVLITSPKFSLCKLVTHKTHDIFVKVIFSTRSENNFRKILDFKVMWDPINYLQIMRISSLAIIVVVNYCYHSVVECAKINCHFVKARIYFLKILSLSYNCY